MRNATLGNCGLGKGGNDGALLLHKLYHIIDKERALVDGCGSGDKGRNVVCDRGERGGIKGVVTDAAVGKHDVVCDVAKEDAGGNGEQKSYDKAPDSLADNEAL